MEGCWVDERGADVDESEQVNIRGRKGSIIGSNYKDAPRKTLTTT